MKCDSTYSFVTGTPQLTLVSLCVAGSWYARAAISQSPSPTGEKYTCDVGVCHQPVVAKRGSRSETVDQGRRVRQTVAPVYLRVSGYEGKAVSRTTLGGVSRASLKA